MKSSASMLSILLSLHCLASSSVSGFAYYLTTSLKKTSNSYNNHNYPSQRRCHVHQRQPDRSERVILSAATSDTKSDQSEYVWEVYVSQQPTNKNKEKGIIPTSSIIQAFISLAPSLKDIKVLPAEFKQNKLKGKGQTVRCIQREKNIGGNVLDADGTKIVNAIEITNVDSLDKVYRIMAEHMKLGEIDSKTVECMKCYIDGNANLEEGEPSNAITLYDQALDAIKRTPSPDRLPKGLILMQRARAYLVRAGNHRTTLRILVKDLTDTVPSASTMKILYQTASTHPSLSPSIFNRLAGDSKVQQAKFRSIRYRHDMYEFALLHAVQDSLQATQLLSQNANSWLLAGECLAELRKLKESNQYYQRALEIDPNMEQTLKVVMEKNRVSQEFMDAARASGFSGDTLRLALDVAA